MKYSSTLAKSMQKGSKELGQTECRKIIKQLHKKLYKKGCDELGNKEFVKVAIN